MAVWPGFVVVSLLRFTAQNCGGHSLLISGSGVRVSNGPPPKPRRITPFSVTSADMTVYSIGRIVRTMSAFVKGRNTHLPPPRDFPSEPLPAFNLVGVGCYRRESANY